MKDFINNLNNEALERLVPIISNTLFDTEFIWGFCQSFYAEDGTSIEFNALGTGSYQIIFTTENASECERVIVGYTEKREMKGNFKRIK
jgi:hypothetical protein